ncbi:MAG: hypothetical protein HYR67_02335 [Bacteroidetes bacterium]|nr:hypothetical protein [Bacteroidota bacterium]
MTRLILLSALILFSCGDNVKFEVPQPEGKGNEDAFPKKIRGMYRNLKDSSLLTITADQITRMYNIRFVVHKSDLDSAIKVKGDTSFYDAVEKLTVTVKGDSAYGRINYIDTLFYISSNNLLRVFKGYYYLNKMKSFNNWEVDLMQVKGKELTILSDWNESDLINMRRITHTSDSTRTFKPTRGQLKKFIREKSMKDGEIYKKI